jgi:hypothetical protein
MSKRNYSLADNLNSAEPVPLSARCDIGHPQWGATSRVPVLLFILSPWLRELHLVLTGYRL